MTGSTYALSEGEHRYGSKFHLLQNPFLSTHLARLCAEETRQPEVNELISTIYQAELQVVVNAEFPRKKQSTKTRMFKDHPREGILEIDAIDPNIGVVSVNLARAGTVPSHVCYTALNYFMDPDRVRQDHISVARATDAQEKVTGSIVSGHKIGGEVSGRIVLFPDPMGATGGTLVEAVSLYKQMGKALKYIALHCIVTPEYLKRVWSVHPDLIVYSVRLDRGLSPPEVLRAVPGEHWDREKGLNSKQYIVPGGGGFGEILNNAYV